MHQPQDWDPCFELIVKNICVASRSSLYRILVKLEVILHEKDFSWYRLPDNIGPHEGIKIFYSINRTSY